jgi:REP element-mobilizing transposase RayT
LAQEQRKQPAPTLPANGRICIVDEPLTGSPALDDNPRFSARQGAYLPHWRKSGAVYAVTFRLADSLPQAVILQYKTEREQLLRALQMNAGEPTKHELEALRKLFSERIDQYLDAGAGACWMLNPAIAKVVANALKHFDTERYRLYAWCVMPNHVHVVFSTCSTFSVESILHSWKSYTAVQANKILNRQGQFWQTEYYDHLIRDEDDLNNQINYIKENPGAAGLKDWPWQG